MDMPTIDCMVWCINLTLLLFSSNSILIDWTQIEQIDSVFKQ